MNLGFVGAFLTIAAVGIAQAHIAYVPDLREKKKRELPPYLARLGRPARIGYVLYAVFASAYVVLAAVSFLVGMAHSFHTVAAAVGQR